MSNNINNMKSSKFIDFLIIVEDVKTFLRSRISILFTVTTDLFKRSRKIIKFKTKSDYYGFKIVMSTTEKNRKAIAWFYRTYDSPNLLNWKEFMEIFNLECIPEHSIQFINKDKTEEKIVTINSITDSTIRITVNSETFSSIINSGTLLPYRYPIIYNSK